MADINSEIMIADGIAIIAYISEFDNADLNATSSNTSLKALNPNSPVEALWLSARGCSALFAVIKNG